MGEIEFCIDSSFTEITAELTLNKITRTSSYVFSDPSQESWTGFEKCIYGLSYHLHFFGFVVKDDLFNKELEYKFSWLMETILRFAPRKFTETRIGNRELESLHNSTFGPVLERFGISKNL
jgi:hypothetical protein